MTGPAGNGGLSAADGGAMVGTVTPTAGLGVGPVAKELMTTVSWRVPGPVLLVSQGIVPEQLYWSALGLQSREPTTVLSTTGSGMR